MEGEDGIGQIGTIMDKTSSSVLASHLTMNIVFISQTLGSADFSYNYDHTQVIIFNNDFIILCEYFVKVVASSFV